MLVVRVLGSLSLQADTGEAITAVPKRRLGLLAVLALGRSDGIARERLQSFFWPESSADRARHALEQAVYAARRSLGSGLVLSEGGRLRLNPAEVDVDAWRFEQAIRDARWADAVDAYGGPLLDAFHLADSWEFEQWLDSERARMRSDHHRALDALAQECEARGDARGALAWRLTLAAADPLSSRVAMDVVRAYVAAGDRSGAIRHARVFQDAVRSQLEVEPDRSVEDLARTLTSSAAPSPADSVAVPPGARAHPSPQPLISQPESTAPVAMDVGAAPRRRQARTRAAATMVLAVMVALVGVIGAVAMRSGTLAAESRTARAAREKQPSAEAEAAYRRGMTAWSERSKDGLDSAVIAFRRAVDLDPGYAEAYAGLASAYVLLGYSGYRPGAPMFAKARAAALRAIAIDSTVAAAHAALGFELTAERRFPEAEAALRRAIALEPSHATAHQWYGILLMILGRKAEAVAETGIAARLDPLSLQIQNTYATFLSAAGRHAEALRHYEKMVGQEPDSAWVTRNPWLLSNMSRVQAENGQFDKALRTVGLALRILPRHPRPLWDLATIHQLMGRPDLAEGAMADADTSNEHYAAYRAMVFAQAGHLDSAFAWFDRVESFGMPIMIALQSNTLLDPLRADPRFRALLARVGRPGRL